MVAALPLTPVVPGATVVVLIASIIMLIEWAGAPKAASAATLSELVNKGIAWSPTRELADEAAAQLENWYRPIREWYADENPAVNDRNQYAADGAVLEIGLLNYEWHTDRLVVQVMMRLVDVETGRVIGRTRHAAYPRIGRAVDILTDDNALKRNFVETARPLVTAGLKDLGLLDPQRRLTARPIYPVVIAPTHVR